MSPIYRRLFNITQIRGGQVKESALITGLVLITYAGLIGGCLMLLDAIRDAHRRGMARVRAYDAREGNE